jgi:hypothetical protein
MDNQPNQPTKQTSKALWIVLVVVILAIVGYSAYAYVWGNTNNADNTNTSTNINQGANVNVPMNTNSGANTNSVVNGNVNINAAVNSNANSSTDAGDKGTINTNSVTNTNIDTSGWKTYENAKYGYLFKYPSDQKVDDYSKYNGSVYNLNLLDNKIVPKPGGFIPISVDVFNNSLGEVKNALNAKYTMSRWDQTTIDNVQGEASSARFSENFYHFYYVFDRGDYTILIETTDSGFILPTVKFT